MSTGSRGMARKGHLVVCGMGLRTELNLIFVSDVRVCLGDLSLLNSTSR